MLTARLDNPAVTLPGALDALTALDQAARATGVPDGLLTLLHLRTSQLSGCSYCVHMHARALRNAGESQERIDAVAAWRDAPFYTGAERAGLALAEAVTRIGAVPEGNPVPDAVWEAAAEHFDEKQLGALVLSVATVGLWNRVNVATRQVAQVP